MFRKKVKKAFTLVELLVVIAILAILATVSVIGYTQFTKRANQSNDMSLTTQINTVLQAEELTGAPETMTDAIAIMEESGANIAELTPTTEGYSYVWNAATNRVILLDENKNVVAPEGAVIENTADCYAIIKSADDLTTWAGYSLYFTREYTGTTFTLAAEDNLVSVDVGTSAIKTLNILTGNGTATIYTTEGSTVTINAPAATINHYGEATTVDIQEVAANSYHLYGTVTEDIQITKGRVVIASGASAQAVVLNGNNIRVDVETNATLNSVGATDAGYSATAQLPGTVEAVVGDTNGILYFDGGFGEADRPYVIASEESWYNFAESELALAGKYWSVEADLNLTEECYVDFKGTIDFNNNTVTSIRSGNYLFSYVSGVDETGAASLSTIKKSTIKNLIYEVNGENNGIVAEIVGTVTLENIEVRGNFVSTTNNTTPFVQYTAIYNNSSVSPELQAVTDVTFINCDNYATISSSASSSAAVYVGSAYGGTLTFKNCANYGTLLHPNGYASMLIANGVTFRSITLDVISVTGCVNYGQIISKTEANLLCGAGWSSTNVTVEMIEAQIASYNEGETKNLINAEGATCETRAFNPLDKTEDGNYLILPKMEGAVRYEFSFNFWVEGYVGDELVVWGSESIVVSLTSSQLNVQIPAYEWINEDEVTGALQTITIGDETFTINNGKYVFDWDLNWNENPNVEYGFDSVPSATFVGYDANGNIVDVYVYTFN